MLRAARRKTSRISLQIINLWCCCSNLQYQSRRSVTATATCHVVRNRSTVCAVVFEDFGSALEPLPACLLAAQGEHTSADTPTHTHTLVRIQIGECTRCIWNTSSFHINAVQLYMKIIYVHHWQVSRTNSVVDVQQSVRRAVPVYVY